MAWREAGSSAALGTLALFALIASARLEIGSVTQPGPGFFPLVLSATLVVVALALLVGAFRSAAAARNAVPEATTPPERTDPWKLLASVGTFAVYIAVFERLGFVLA